MFQNRKHKIYANYGFLRKSINLLLGPETSVLILITIEYFYWWFKFFSSFPLRRVAAIAVEHEDSIKTFDYVRDTRHNSILRLDSVGAEVLFNSEAIIIMSLPSQWCTWLCRVLGLFQIY